MQAHTNRYTAASMLAFH